MASSRVSDYKALGGKLVRVRLHEHGERLESVQITGDFFLLPEDGLSKLEKTLQGVMLEEQSVRTEVERFFRETGVQTLGVSQDDIIRSIVSARDERVTA